jgi:hypothetical protein
VEDLEKDACEYRKFRLLQKSHAEGWQSTTLSIGSSRTEVCQNSNGMVLMLRDTKKSSANLKISTGVYPCKTYMCHGTTSVLVLIFEFSFGCHPQSPQSTSREKHRVHFPFHSRWYLIAVAEKCAPTFTFYFGASCFRF